jgi:arylsulfatase A
MASTLDILPTVAGLANAALPPNPVDGVDIWPVMTGEADSVDRPLFLYFDYYNLQCVRSGRWKLHMARYNSPAYTPEPKVGRYNLRLLTPELYDLDTDSEESAEVQAEWRDTQHRAVYPNTPGAWPVPIT